MNCYTLIKNPQRCGVQKHNILISSFTFEIIQKNLINMKLGLIYKPHIDFIITLSNV